MNIPIIGGLVGNVVGLFQAATNPVEVIGLILAGVGIAVASPLILDVIFKFVDDAIIWADNTIIDKIPFPAIKKWAQGILIKRLRKRIARYEAIIIEISD